MSAKNPGRERDRLKRTVRMGQLLEIYGPLLTERQREFTRLHHNEDMSFGEIAREYRVSRQAVHDAVRQAEAAMEHYEARLGLLSRLKVVGQATGRRSASSRSSGPSKQAVADVVSRLEDLRKRLATQGIIYDPDEFVRSLDSALDRLKRLV